MTPQPAPGTDQRTAFVSGFTSDIFISYAHIDNAIDDEELEQRGWVDRFARSLDVQLSKRLGKRPKIWFDQTNLKKSDKISPSIDGAVRKSALFLVLISNRSLLSESCREECRLIEETVGDAARPDTGTQSIVFPVALYNLPPATWPAACQGLAGHRFYVAKDEDDEGRPLDVTRDATAYKSRFDDLLTELTVLLKSMKRLCAPLVTVVDEKHYRVFLTSAPGSRQTDRLNLTGALQKRGIEVVQKIIPPPYKADEHEAALRSCLSQADLSLHLLDQTSGGALDAPDTDRCYPEEQCRIAYGTGGTQLLILPENLDLASVETRSHREFLKLLTEGKWPNADPGNRITIARARQTDTIVELVERALEQKFRPPAAVPLQPGGAAFVDTTTRDLTFAVKLFEFLEKNRLEPITIPTSEESPGQYQALFADNVARSAAIIIVYGQVTREWVKGRLQRAFSLIIEKDLKVRPVVYAAPPPKSDQDIDFRQCSVADCRGGFDEKEFARALKAGLA